MKVKAGAGGRLASPAACAGIIAFVVFGSPAIAQTNPSTLERESERQRTQIEQQTAPRRQTGPNVVGPGAAARVEFPPGGTTVLLREVRIDKSSLLSSDEIEAIKRKYVGRRVDLAQIGALVQEINDIYAARGHITASAILPPQKLTQGVLTVKLIEGKLGNLTVTGAVQTSPSYIKSSVPVAAGDTVDVPALNRSIAIFNRTNETQLRAQLRAGGQFGLTDIELATTEPPRNIVQIFGDNQAATTAGRYQAGLYWRLHGLFGIDDRLTTYGVISRGSLYGSSSFTLPITPYGTRLGLSYSRSGNHVVDGPLLQLRSKGESQNSAVNLSQPLFGTEALSLLAIGSFTLGDTRSDQLEVNVVRSSFQRWTGGLAFTWTSPIHSLSVSPTISRVHWKNSIAGASSDFTILGGNTTNFVRFSDQLYASLVGSWQYSRDPLPGDQTFQIGGPTTVRGYPIGVAAGDSGYYGQAELHYAFGDALRNVDVFAFIDHGAVFATFPKMTRASAAGVGVSWRPAEWVTLESSVGFPIVNVASSQRSHEVYVRLSFRPQIN
ncbi:ShlB/FhaC/HecB family hemolysin secretion/activation protein [Terrarubrum flagellatum]|uniref:ShlB/FhaC/HecB family hemolysin secretion/activation protein n=1 Tax=Terrirubrum flagellatum TaxID=2895980 RepID=UPI0031452A54